MAQNEVVHFWKALNKILMIKTAKYYLLAINQCFTRECPKMRAGGVFFMIGSNCFPQQQWFNWTIRTVYMVTSQIIRQDAWQLKNHQSWQQMVSRIFLSTNMQVSQYPLFSPPLLFFLYKTTYFEMGPVLLGPILRRRDHWFSFLWPRSVDMSWLLKERAHHVQPILENAGYNM